MWDSFGKGIIDYQNVEIPPHLQKVENVPLQTLIDELNSISYSKRPVSKQMLILYVVISVIILIVIVVMCVKYHVMTRIRLCISSNQALTTLGSRISHRLNLPGRVSSSKQEAATDMPSLYSEGRPIPDRVYPILQRSASMDTMVNGPPPPVYRTGGNNSRFSEGGFLSWSRRALGGSDPTVQASPVDHGRPTPNAPPSSFTASNRPTMGFRYVAVPTEIPREPLSLP